MSNLYTQLRDLFKEAPRLVGDVLAIEDGTATVQLLNGGLIAAVGETTVGARVYVRSGAIEGPAPTLPYYEIEV